MATPLLIDWNLATATATRLVPAGPSVGYLQAAEVVADLRRAAEEADEHVAAVTELTGDPDLGPVVVVDRPDWIRGNVAGFATVVDPLAEQLLARSAPSALLATVGSRITAVQVGSLLAYLSTRVLGQYEVFLPAGSGRLSLVAPNIVAAEQRLGVDPHDFRRWVALHEVTHRTQFTAVPWLRGHILDLLSRFVLASDLEPTALLRRLREALSDAAARRERSVVELVTTPDQRRILDSVTGLMSLLEGHAEYVMDRVGADLLPSVEQLRSRLDARRTEGNPAERLLRRLLGMEMKMRQYAEGVAFVRAVVDRIGVSGLNQVWAGPEFLPDAGEIREPGLWLARIAGSADGGR
jgi:coenzyme F420 biosynthesis associated uncharacterized protein